MRDRSDGRCFSAQSHRWSTATSPSTCSTCLPHPAKVGRSQVGHSTRLHIPPRVSELSSRATCDSRCRRHRRRYDPAQASADSAAVAAAASTSSLTSWVSGVPPSSPSLAETAAASSFLTSTPTAACPPVSAPARRSRSSEWRPSPLWLTPPMMPPRMVSPSGPPIGASRMVRAAAELLGPELPVLVPRLERLDRRVGSRLVGEESDDYLPAGHGRLLGRSVGRVRAGPRHRPSSCAPTNRSVDACPKR